MTSRTHGASRMVGVTEMDAPAKALAKAMHHLHGADHELRMCLTLLRQERREVPDTIDDAIALLADAISILESAPA